MQLTLIKRRGAQLNEKKKKEKMQKRKTTCNIFFIESKCVEKLHPERKFTFELFHCIADLVLCVGIEEALDGATTDTISTKLVRLL